MRKPQPCVCCCNMSTTMTLSEQSHYLVSCPNTMFSKQNWHQLPFLEDYIPQPLSASLQVMTTFKTKDRWAHEVWDTLLEPDWRCSFSVVRWSCYLLWSYDTQKKKKNWAFTSFPSSALPCDENALVLVLVPQRAVGLVCQSVAAKAQTRKPPRYICTQLTAVHVYSLTFCGWGQLEVVHARCTLMCQAAWRLH